MSTTPDGKVPVKRLQLDVGSGMLIEVPPKALFLRGPIPLEWLSAAAQLPGKALNVGLALWWLRGMSAGKSIKLTRKALAAFNVERDAERAGLSRLEQAGLIHVMRRPGQRPTVSILKHPRSS